MDNERSKPVTESEVRRAALRLLRTGANPSTIAVRRALGDRGSNSTITQYLKNWRDQIVVSDTEILPENIPGEVLGAVEEFWRIAEEAASKGFASERKRLEETANSALDEKEAMRLSEEGWKVFAERKAAELSKAESLAEEFRSQAEEQRQLRKEREQEVDHLKDRIAAIESRHDEDKRSWGAERDQMTSQFESEKDQLESSIKAAQRQAEETYARAEKMSDYWLLQVDKERDETRKAREEGQKAVKNIETDLAISRTRESRAYKQIESLEQNILHLQEKLDSQDLIREKHESEINNLRLEKDGLLRKSHEFELALLEANSKKKRP